MSTCPCGTGKPFQKCCKPFLLGKSLPKTPEELMRSRYTAYTKGNIDYIVATQAKTAAIGFDKKDAAGWASGVQWLRLQIKHTEVTGKNEGVVEFIASYRTHGEIKKMHEVSRFERVHDRWFYVGEITAAQMSS